MIEDGFTVSEHDVADAGADVVDWFSAHALYSLWKSRDSGR